MRRRSWFSRWSSSTLRFLALGGWALALGVISIRVWFKPNSHSVFTLFREAGAHWVQAADLYSHGSKFLYSPLAAAGFAPFSFLAENIAGIAWRCFGGVLLAMAVHRTARIIWPEQDDGRRWWAVLALLPLALSNLNNGQTNPLVLSLMVFSIAALLKEQWFVCSLSLAVASYFKIYPLALGLLLSTIYLRRLSWRLLLTVTGLFAISLVLQRPGYVLTEYASWLTHLGSVTRRSADESRAWRDAYFLFRMAGLPITPRAWIMVEVFAGVVMAGFCLWGVSSSWPRARLIYGAFGLGCAWMVLFGPATEAASYLLLGPAILYGFLESWRLALPMWIRGGMTGSYVGLLLAEVSDSWLRLKGLTVYARAFQPTVAVLFLVTLVGWLAAARLWRTSRV